MTRHIICREGVLETFNNTLLEPESIWWDEGRIPLAWDFRWDAEHLLGYCEDLKREKNGDITAELTFVQREKEVWEVRHDVGATIYARSLVSKMQNGVRVVNGAKVTAVTITLGVPWRLSDWELSTGGEQVGGG